MHICRPSTPKVYVFRLNTCVSWWSKQRGKQSQLAGHPSKKYEFLMGGHGLQETRGLNVLNKFDFIIHQ